MTGRIDKLIGVVWPLLLTVGLVMVIAGVVMPTDDPVNRDRPRVTADLPDGAPPDRLVVPSIGLDAPLEPIEVNEQAVLDPPADVSVVGWWQRSAHPAQSTGQTVLTGHTVNSGGGVMNRLGDLKRRDRVQVYDDNRRITYDVTKVVVYSTAEVAEKAVDLFGQDRPGGRLVLVTCTDFDGEKYQSNIIVFGKPVAISEPS